MAETKPYCKLTGTNGNVFALAGRVAAALKKAKQETEATAMVARLRTCQSYDEALRLFMEYVDVR